jgi:uncharacterized protein involved in exopolysaccharide biosynthesis
VKLSQKSLEFIQTELDRLSTQIREVEAQVAQVKAANPGRMPQEIGANQLRLDRIVASISAARRQLAEAESDAAFYRTQSTNAASMSAPNDDASPGRRLQILELALSQYKSRGYTEKHPDVISAKAEIETLKQRLVDEKQAGEDGTKPITNYVQQSAEAESRRAALQAQAAAEEIRGLTQQADEIQILLNEAPAVAEQLEALERDYKHLFESYQEFSNKQLEASVQANLERRQLAEQFRVLEVAFKAPEPTSPNRPAIVILGLVFALAIGGAVGILLEAIDPSLHTARQLQAALRLPVLAAIPRIWLESDRVTQRRARIRGTLATVAVAAFGLLGGAVNYVWVNGAGGAAAQGLEGAPPAVAAPAGESVGEAAAAPAEAAPEPPAAAPAEP